MLARMRCLHAMGEWDRLSQLSKEIWKKSQDTTRALTAPLAAAAAWNLGEWNAMEEYLKFK
jgi:serine/threonine-protein kinase mTOR